VEPTDYLRSIERRWRVVAACVLVALAAGWLFSRGGNESEAPARSFRATTYLISSSTLSSASAALRGATNLQTIAALVRIGEVPERVAEAIEFDGDPGDLTASIEVVADPATGLLTITATSPTAPRAKLLADEFAQQLLAYLRERTLDIARGIQDQIGELEEQIADLEDQAAVATDEEERTLLEQRDALGFRRDSLTTQYSQLTSSTGGNPSGLEILEPATATPISVGPGLLAPRSQVVLILIAAIVGLLLGVGIALILERFDTKLQSKEAAEDAFKLPVLGEIPVIPRRRRGSVVTGAFPHAPASNAFRLLAAALQFGRRGHFGATDSTNGDRSWGTILVTSAAPSEGKSTTVANLAATFAQVGKRVIVLCCDFRHPSLHVTFGVKQTPGLSDIPAEDGTVELKGFLQETQLEHVRVLSTGRVPDNTSGMFGSDRMRIILAAARAASDVVLIDTAPVLAASDWAQLLPEVDAVLVVARAGKTDAGSAERTAEILETLQAPVVGVVLNRLPRSVVSRGRYGFGFGYGGYGAPEKQEEPAVDPTAEEHGAVEGNGDGGEDGRDRSQTSDGGFPHLSRPSTKA